MEEQSARRLQTALRTTDRRTNIAQAAHHASRLRVDVPLKEGSLACAHFVYISQ